MTIVVYSAGATKSPQTQPSATQSTILAVGEELFFRGFWQGELNLAMGKPWKLGATRFGWGVVAVALLFGIGHLLNPFDPIQGSYELYWRGFAYSGGFAFAAGLLREKFDSLLPCIVMHVSWNIYGAWVLQNVSGQLAFSIAAAVAIVVCIFFALRSRQSASTVAVHETEVEKLVRQRQPIVIFPPHSSRLK